MRSDALVCHKQSIGSQSSLRPSLPTLPAMSSAFRKKSRTREGAWLLGVAQLVGAKLAADALLPGDGQSRIPHALCPILLPLFLRPTPANAQRIPTQAFLGCDALDRGSGAKLQVGVTQERGDSLSEQEVRGASGQWLSGMFAD